MKFLLIKSKYESFSSPREETKNSRNFRGTVLERKVELGVKICPKKDYYLERKEKRKEKRLIARLHQKLINNFKSKNKTVSDPEPEIQSQFWKLVVEMGVSETPKENTPDQFKGYLKLKGLFKENCLQGLREISNGKAKIQIKINLAFSDPENDDLDVDLIHFDVRTIDLPIKGKEMAHCQDWNIGYPICHLGNWKTGSIIAMFSVSVILPAGILTNAFLVQSNNHKMLQKGVLSDLTIVASNGARIKAHKSFLAAQSSVFLTMFQSDMNENRDSVVEISDISEAGIRALLRYLYCNDTTAARTNSQVLFELFYAGHKYDIASLETAMREVIARKPSEKYDVEEILGLFLFARKLMPKDDELMKKSVQVLSLHGSKLEESATYQELFKKDPEAAMDLCRHALNTCSFSCRANAKLQ